MATPPPHPSADEVVQLLRGVIDPELGSDVVDVARPLGQTVFLKGLTSSELDITDPVAVKETVGASLRGTEIPETKPQDIVRARSGS